jgi:predicted component of type VI protein secretion system
MTGCNVGWNSREITICFVASQTEIKWWLNITGIKKGGSNPSLSITKLTFQNLSDRGDLFTKIPTASNVYSNLIH